MARRQRLAGGSTVRAVGVPVQKVGAILQGERRPTNATLAKLARRFLILLLIATSVISGIAYSVLSTTQISPRQRITSIHPVGSSDGRVEVPDLLHPTVIG